MSESLIQKLGISIVAPDHSILLGPANKNEPTNYVWPWIEASVGAIDIAKAPSAKGRSLGEKLDTHLASPNLRKAFHVSDVTLIEIAGFPIYRVALESTSGLQIVRFYLLAIDDQLAFLHLHSWTDREALESIAKSIRET